MGLRAACLHSQQVVILQTVCPSTSIVQEKAKAGRRCEKKYSLAVIEISMSKQSRKDARTSRQQFSCVNSRPTTTATLLLLNGDSSSANLLRRLNFGLSPVVLYKTDASGSPLLSRRAEILCAYVPLCISLTCQ